MTSFRFMMVVEDPKIARFAWENGVDRLFVDLEIHGKHERQKHLASWKSSSTIDDAMAIRKAAPEAHLLIRVNPIHSESAQEIDDVVAAGADSIMLPMFHTAEEAVTFHEIVDGRALTIPLFETVDSLGALAEIVGRGSLSEAHIGLNDLHLDRGDTFMFEPLIEGVLEDPCFILRTHQIPFGIGGLARAGEGIVSPDFLLGEHVRLGSGAGILSRSFHRSAKSVDELERTMDFAGEVTRLRAIYAEFQKVDDHALEANRVRTADRVRDVVRLIKSKSAEAAAS